MSWFSSRGAGPRQPRPERQHPEQPAVPALPALPAATAGGPESHRSLGLASLIGGLTAGQRLHILDLGPVVGGNVEFLSRFGCKLYIQDLYPAVVPLQAETIGLPAPGAATVATIDRAAVREARETWDPRPFREGGESDEPGLAGHFAELLTFPEETRFDAVLTWDLINYLERREVAALARQLARFCRPGAQLFALISILKQIPAEPMRFRILDQEHLAYESRTSSQRPCPRYAPAELAELLRGFRLDRSFLMRHGIQEYLFTREEP
ncbi:MAG TPA: class I SAM-dependent methyltransferase [Thermoanaerobaculia bacterium]|nr:class I SAM-dependent methyltransferase [Thermoanaerobaculia bacterium]